MDQNDNPGGSIGGNVGSTGGGAGSVGGSSGGSSGAASGSGSVGSGFGSQPGSAGGHDDFGNHEVHYYRSDFDARTDRPAEHTFDQARAGYQLGHTAAAQPANQNREFMEVEVDLEKENSRFADLREYARSGFEWKRVLGGLALAGGAYWAGKKVYEAVSESNEEETHYRTHYEAHPARTTVTYPQARTYYVVGYTAARNPAYYGRPFDEVEPEIRRGFTGSRAQSYESMRDFCRYGYERGHGRTRGTGSSGGM
ncbi:MAG: hypothetical protein M3P24_02760 [Gemmatimonadota bacterium]|nr:hypothetical protein [Gemmatimonadota bacterium]